MPQAFLIKKQRHKSAEKMHPVVVYARSSDEDEDVNVEDDEEVAKSPSNGIELPQFMNESTGKIVMPCMHCNHIYLEIYTDTGLPLR